MPAIGTPPMDVTVHVFTGGVVKFWANKVGVASKPQANPNINGKEFMATFPRNRSIARLGRLLVSVLLRKCHILASHLQGELDR